VGGVDLLGVACCFDGSGGVLLSVLYLLQDLEGSSLLFYGRDLLLDFLEGWRAGVCDDVGWSAIGRGWLEGLCVYYAFLLVGRTHSGVFLFFGWLGFVLHADLAAIFTIIIIYFPIESRVG
jgi:hypothetical protein